MFDVIVIGGGIVGTAVLSELSHLDIKSLLLEKDEDVSCGCSKANSGIVHAGYDAKEETLKARFNVEGNLMFEGLCRDLDVPYKKIGSLVLAGEEGLSDLEALLERGKANGVEGLEILGRKRLLEIEPEIADRVQYGLYAPTAGVVSPYEMTIALARHAMVNGAEVLTDKEVIDVKYEGGCFNVLTQDGSLYKSRVLINCAGYGSKQVSEMVGQDTPEVSYKRGDYMVLDSCESDKYFHTCFPLPDANGKGILLTPTAEGNIILGPTGFSVDSGTDTAVAEDGLELIRTSVPRMIRDVNFDKCIRVFAGVRCTSGHDFIIKNGDNPDYIYLQGICSPGLTAAPAIARYVVNELLYKTTHFCGMEIQRKEKIEYLPPRVRPRELSVEEWQKLAKERPEHAVIVCRCEKVTKGEILDVLKGPLPPRSVDALKRRVRTTMGRCQGSFCTPNIIEILAEFYGTSVENITKNGKGSEIVTGGIKE